MVNYFIHEAAHGGAWRQHDCCNFLLSLWYPDTLTSYGIKTTPTGLISNMKMLQILENSFSLRDEKLLA